MDNYSIIIELSLNPVDLSDILQQLFKTVKIMDVLVLPSKQKQFFFIFLDFIRIDSNSIRIDSN
jgi:hypothetical protein